MKNFFKVFQLEICVNTNFLNTYMFQNEDGTKTMYMMYENVKYKDKSGNIKDKDISLIEDDENYKVKDNNVGLSIPKSPHKGIEVNYDNNIVKIIPIKNNSSAKNATTMENNAVTYKNYYGEGVDLKYTPLLSGVKEDIILTEYIQQEYKFTLETNGLNVYEKEGKYYLAKDETSERIYDIGEVLVYDAVGKPTKGQMIIVPKKIGKTYEISISVSDEYLKDETTVYPVTIDPTIKVTDDITGAGNIEDAPVFSGKQTAKCGNYIYLSAGYVDSAHKVGRVVVRVPGLYDSDEYFYTPASGIKSVKFYCKDGSGNASSYMNLYPNTSNPLWDEYTITWATGCNFTTDEKCGATMSSGNWTCFDITDLAKAWKDRIYDERMGFTLVNSNESSTAYRKAIFSSEYGVTADRPYVEMTYANSAIYISEDTIELIEGHMTTLNVTTKPSNLNLTYTSDNVGVALVNNQGQITAKKAGVANITIRGVDAIGNVVTEKCTVYVKIENGVYYIKNNSSKYYLTVESGEINNYTPVCQQSKLTQDPARLSQMWKIYYLGNGYYSIRPLHNVRMGLDVTNHTVDIYQIPLIDSLSIGNYGKWKIEYNNSGYYFTNAYSSTYVLQLGNSTYDGSYVVAKEYSTKAEARWTLEKVSSPPSGVLLYDIGSQELVGGHTEYVAINETRSLEDNGLLPVAYSGVTTAQNFYWSSTNANIAKVDSSTGTVTGIKEGTATIRGTIRLGTMDYVVTYTIKVPPIENGSYYMLNKETDKFVDIYDQIMANGTVIHQWEAHGGATQKWQFTHVGDGYYTIKSINSSTTPYYLAVSGNSTADKAGIVLKSGNISNGMKWRVERTSSGALKITARTGVNNSRVLALEDLDTGNDNGDILQQRVYANDNNYKDEWELMKAGDDVFLLGVRDNSGGHDHINCYIDVMRTMQENGIDSFNINSTNSIAMNTCAFTMSDSKYFVTRGHGGSDSRETYISLSDEDSPDALENKYDKILNAYDIYNFEDDNPETAVKYNFSNVEIAIFVGCETANHSDRSLLHAAVNAGAKYAIGFKEKINCNQANVWTEYFWKYYFSGEYDVRESAEAAAKMAMIIYPVLEENKSEGLFDDSIKSVQVID